MSEDKTLTVTNIEEWRSWLETNFGKEKSIWLVFNKKHTGKTNITYEDTVEEALCFGWIDSLIKKIDDEKYARKFTPRTNKMKWSASNIRLIKKLTAEGRIRQSGMDKIPAAILEINAEKAGNKTVKSNEIPQFIKNALKENSSAESFFYKLAPSHKKHYIDWITGAKKDETKKKRLAEAIKMLSGNQKLGLK